MKQPLLVVENLTKRFSEMIAVNDVCLRIFSGELLAILGPSGSGKSTLLQLVAGLAKPDSGSVRYADVNWAGPAGFVLPEKRDCGMVFQDMALFPHLSVADNIGFAVPRPKKEAVVQKMLRLVGLEGFETRMPHELSGGQQQRVALARSLAPEPGLLLLDEPFSSLDLQLRQIMRREVRDILKRQQVSAILVTHDQSEAFAFADTVAVMFDGHIEQQGSPLTIYQQPATQQVAAFVGEANFVSVEQALKSFAPLAALGTPLDNSENVFMCRPEDLILGPENPCATIISTEFQGAWQELRLRLDCGELLRVHSSLFWENGQRVGVMPQRGCMYCSRGRLLGTYDSKSR